ncbi:SGNH/GDSL hydrolase family protein [Dethiosulfatarculus sandiegensis]|uniref:SGNH hydrolase-type esterase domain-containing protein n=1 Tax=Dethiosulfatarculus sandiegensis TaxID=1429043 RepID=A0A0D2JDV7_9BACT|nr:SGNH/GDSL hydrolase family protein [Dethiosulfatarculus sandiegensis]KIX13851.1 hypothetical protein X474_11325 [Dethiosulfatarculus sandiegensis]
MRIFKWIDILLALLVVFFLVKLGMVLYTEGSLAWDNQEIGLALFWVLLSLGLWALCHFREVVFKPKNMISTGLVLGSLVVGLLLFELIMAPFNMVFDSANIHGIDFNKRKQHAEKNPQAKDSLEARLIWWGKDLELGYKPLYGPQYAYSELGALHNNFEFKKKPGTVRVVFSGDSITAYGFTEEALAELNPDPNYEYWNTGVWGYSTWQELRYFERYGRKLKPDVVILGFCLNDWDGTPVLLRDKDGKVTIANLHLGETYFNYWLFKHSTIYRIFLSVMASFTERAGTVESVGKKLAQFLAYAKEDGFAFRVVVYPELDHLDKWDESYVRQHRQILEILKELKIPYYDTAPLLGKLLKGKDRAWARMKPDDHFHPSRAFSRDIAKELLARGFLKPLPDKNTASGQ